MTNATYKFDESEMTRIFWRFWDPRPKYKKCWNHHSGGLFLLLGGMGWSFMHNSWQIKPPSPTEPKGRKFSKISRPYPPKMQNWQNRRSGGLLVLLADINLKFCVQQFIDANSKSDWTKIIKKNRKIWDPAPPPKKWKSLKSLKHALENFICLLVSKYKGHIPYSVLMVS